MARAIHSGVREMTEEIVYGRRDGSQAGLKSGGRGRNRNPDPCPTSGPGEGRGVGRGRGRNRT